MKHVLFVCIENSARSQMAEAFFNKYASGAVAHSAGSNPAASVDPRTVEVMKEKGIDLVGKKTNKFDLLSARNFDFIVTMGCGDACPVTPKEKTIAWNIENPKGKSVQKYREVRDLIEAKAMELMREIEDG